MQGLTALMDSIQPRHSAPDSQPTLHPLAEMLVKHLEERKDSPIVACWMPGREQ
jgi:hypothetical protein